MIIKIDKKEYQINKGTRFIDNGVNIQLVIDECFKYKYIKVPKAIWKKLKELDCKRDYIKSGWGDYSIIEITEDC